MRSSLPGLAGGLTSRKRVQKYSLLSLPANIGAVFFEENRRFYPKRRESPLYIKDNITHPRRKKRGKDGKGTARKAGKRGEFIRRKGRKKRSEKGRKAGKGKAGAEKKGSAGRAGLVYEPVPSRGVMSERVTDRTARS